MKRAAIYARFSSDRQNEHSCRDQIALCGAWAERQGLSIVETFEDQAVSGSSTINRFGLAALMRAAGEGRFDIVICEALDRLSRDQADLATIKKQLAFREISIMTVQDGEVGAMHIGLKGLMGELYLADLAQKTRRGLQARVRDGASGGGRSYGYDPVPGQPGAMTINAREAKIVVEIFERYVAGETPRAIVAQLNARNIPGPRGGKWNSSTVNGSRERQNGILQNRLYIGEIVWNRQRFIKDPATGKRVSRLNPESEWLRTAVPDLAIVEPDLFERAGRIKAAKGGVRPEISNKPKHLFSGLLKCGCCGASYTVIGRDRIGCAGHRERGDCANTRTLTRKHVEERVLAALQSQLAAPDLLAEYVRVYHEERRRLASSTRDNRKDLEKRQAELAAAIERIVDRIVDGTAPDALVARMNAMETERKQIATTLAGLEDEAEPIALHPAAAEKYRRLVESIQSSLEDAPQGQELAAVFDQVRGLVERIDIEPGPDSKKPATITVHGLLSQLLIGDTGLPMYGSVGCGGRI